MIKYLIIFLFYLIPIRTVSAQVRLVPLVGFEVDYIEYDSKYDGTPFRLINNFAMGPVAGLEIGYTLKSSKIVFQFSNSFRKYTRATFNNFIAFSHLRHKKLNVKLFFFKSLTSNLELIVGFSRSKIYGINPYKKSDPVLVGSTFHDNAFYLNFPFGLNFLLKNVELEIFANVDLGFLVESPFSKVHTAGLLLKYPFQVKLPKRRGNVNCPDL